MSAEWQADARICTSVCVLGDGEDPETSQDLAIHNIFFLEKGCLPSEAIFLSILSEDS